MEYRIKKFEELTVDELFDIYKLRADVFVVEQNCAYCDIDEFDKIAYHICIYNNGELVALARLLPEKTCFEEVGIGRVIAKYRRDGLGTKVVNTALETAQKKFNATKVVVHAQSYAQAFYESLGFRVIGEEFLEDNIPHKKMIWEK